MAGLPHVAAVAAGRYHSLALDGRGRVWAWGLDACGRAGGEAPGGLPPHLVRAVLPLMCLYQPQLGVRTRLISLAGMAIHTLHSLGASV